MSEMISQMTVFSEVAKELDKLHFNHLSSRLTPSVAEISDFISVRFHFVHL